MITFNINVFLFLQLEAMCKRNGQLNSLFVSPGVDRLFRPINLSMSSSTKTGDVLSPYSDEDPRDN